MLQDWLPCSLQSKLHSRQYGLVNVRLPTTYNFMILDAAEPSNLGLRCVY